MKHLPIVLAMLVGIIVGTALGYYLGSDSDSITPSAAPITSAATNAAAHPGNETRGEQFSSRPGSTDRAWIESFQENLRHASPGQPTPRIVETIGEALSSDPPLDTARLLLLIQTMRKEDFPVALHLFRTVKSSINEAYATGNGPITWIAFWQQFGAIDPETALTSALQCDDLKFAQRHLLEKHLFTGLARNNADAAARIFLSTSDLPNRPFAAEGLAFEWGKSNPGAALAWAEKSLTGEELAKASYAIMWGASTFRDISGGNALLKTLPTGEIRSSALRSLKSQILNKPNVAAPQIIEFMTITRGLQERDAKFENRVAARCADQDPVAAANFYAQSTEDDAASDYQNLRTVLKQWIVKDRSAAETWAKGQANTPHFDAITRELQSASPQ